MPREPFDLLQHVSDESSFRVFLAALAADFGEKSSDLNEWENDTVETFLAAAVRWGQDSERGLPLINYTPSANPWRRCAEILYAGKIYE